MSFVRPEAQAAMARWWGLALALAFVGLGVWWAFTGVGLLPYLGALIAVAGALFAGDQLRRALFNAGRGGAGVVEVDERQITYMTSGGGTSVSIDGLKRVEIETHGANRRDWVFHSDGGGVLYVPLNAAGAEALFDAVSALPGVQSGEAIRGATARRTDRFMVWQKDRRALH